MKSNPKLRTALIIYAVILYGLWSLLELYVKAKLGVNEFTKEVYIKLILWFIPAILIHSNFDGSMFSQKNEMYSLNKSCLTVVPIMLLFSVFIIVNKYAANGRPAINEAFGISTVIKALSVGIGEETVFRGLFLNAMLNDKKKLFTVFINSLMFLAIHFPVWIHSGTFISVFTSGGAFTVLLLSCIFGFVFIRTKSIYTAAFLHFWWDLLLYMFD